MKKKTTTNHLVKVRRCQNGIPRPFRSSLRGNSWPSERGTLAGVCFSWDNGGWFRNPGSTHQLRLVVYPFIPLFTGFGIHPRWLGMGFQPSTVAYRVRIQYQNISKYLKFFHGHVVEENPTNPIDSFDIHNPWLEYWVFPEYWGVQLDKAQVRWVSPCCWSQGLSVWMVAFKKNGPAHDL